MSSDSLISLAKLTRFWNDLKTRVLLKTDAVSATAVSVDNTPTASSTNLVTSGGVQAFAVESLTSGGKKIWCGTQAEYDLLTPDANTLYFIKAS